MAKNEYKIIITEAVDQSRLEKAGFKDKQVGTTTTTKGVETRTYRDLNKNQERIAKDTISANNTYFENQKKEKEKSEKISTENTKSLISANNKLRSSFIDLPKSFIKQFPKGVINRQKDIPLAQEALKAARTNETARKNRQKKQAKADREEAENTLSMQKLEAIKSKNIAKMYGQQIKAKEEAEKIATKSLVGNIKTRKDAEIDQEKKLQSDQRDYWRNAKKERDRLVKEQSKRESSMENLRKANHKKQVTRYKTRSALSRNLSTMSLSLNMSMLGIMFSFMSLFSIITGVFGSIFAAASNLTGAVSGGALAEAFLSPEALKMTAINPETGKEEAIGLKRQGMDVGSLVESYKKSLGVQGEMAYQMSKLSAALLNNPEFMAGVMSAIDVLSNTFSDPEFVRSVVKSMKAIMDMLPDVLDSLLILLDLTTMFIPFLQTWLPLILASVILLPILSLFNAVFGVVAMGFAVTNELLAAILVSQEATRLASVASSGVIALGAPAAAAGGGLAGGMLGGLSWAAVTSGIGKAITGALALGPVALGLAALVGTVLGLIGVGILDAIGVLDWAGEIGGAFGEWLSGSEIGTALGNLFIVLTSPISMLGALFVGLVEGGIDGAMSRVSEMWNLILTAIEIVFFTMFRNIVKPIVSLISTITNTASGVLSNLGENIFTKTFSDVLGLGWYATGGQVTNTGLAMVHEGEYISNSSEPTSNGNVSQNVNITVYGDLDSKAADKVIDELVAQQRYSSWS